MESSCFLHSPLSHSHSRFPFSSLPIFSHSKNAETKRRRTSVAMSSLRQEDLNDGDHGKRRAILFVGISVLPLLQLRAKALEGLATTTLQPEDLGLSLVEDGLVEVVVTTEAAFNRSHRQRNKPKWAELDDGPSTLGSPMSAASLDSAGKDKSKMT